jgi:hypothetical protein
MGPLVRVMYSGLTQSVFSLDRVKYSSFECLEKFPKDSNTSCDTSFSPTLHLVYVIAQA